MTLIIDDHATESTKKLLKEKSAENVEKALAEKYGDEKTNDEDASLYLLDPHKKEIKLTGSKGSITESELKKILNFFEN